MKWYTPAEVAQMLKLDQQVVWQKLRSGELESDRVGQQYRVTQDQLSRFLEDSPEVKLRAWLGGLIDQYQRQGMDRTEAIEKLTDEFKDLME